MHFSSDDLQGATICPTQTPPAPLPKKHLFILIQTQFGILKNGVKRVVQLTILTPKIDLEPIGYMGPAKAH